MRGNTDGKSLIVISCSWMSLLVGCSLMGSSRDINEIPDLGDAMKFIKANCLYQTLVLISILAFL